MAFRQPIVKKPFHEYKFSFLRKRVMKLIGFTHLGAKSIAINPRLSKTKILDMLSDVLDLCFQNA